MDFLQEQGLSPDAARKRISRLPAEVQRLGACLPNKEIFLYLENQWGTPEYFERLAEALKESGSALGLALIGLEARGGMVKANHFPVASGLSVRPTKKQISHDTAEMKLINLRIISRDGSSSGWVSADWSPRNPLRGKSLELAEDMVLSLLRTSLTRMGVISYSTVSIRGDTPHPEFASFAWDLVGPSYLAGFASRNGTDVKPAFVVADVVLGQEITMEYLKPFLHKCDTIRSRQGHRPFLPIFVADSFGRDALQELRKRGYVAGTLVNLFGKHISDDLRSLVNTVQNAAAAVTSNPEKVFELLGRLNKIEGAALNLRGVVFEFIVARLFALRGYNVDIRKEVGTKNGRAEIDVKAQRTDEVVCVECKAKSPGNLTDVQEIRDWVETRLPRIKEWLSVCPSLPQTKRFMFYISGDMTKDARQYAEEVAKTHNKQPIEVITGNLIIRELTRMKQQSLVRVYREQFSDKTANS